MKESVPLAMLEQIDDICLRFEAAWKAGQQLDVEVLLHQVPQPAERELLLNLIGLDLEYRRRRGELPDAADYAARFSDHGAMIEELVREFLRTPHLPDTVDAGGQAGQSSQVHFAVRATNSTGQGAGAATGSAPKQTLGQRPLPRVLGKFEVVRPLKRGGQASAILAFDPDLKRHVVLKLYRMRAAQDTVLGEGQALAQVRSPYVAHCFGVERHEGVPYLVVEYIPGQDLADWQRSRPLDVAAALDITAQLAEGLAAVHACGLLHRDIKPANVLIGDDCLPRLVDFGLAARLGSDALRDISGTVPYMAPEQAQGLVERIDQRTDVFGLGALLYELLSGRPPYQAATVDELSAAARAGDVVPPRQHNLRLPEAVNQLCMSCLAKDPADRFQSAAALRDALRSWQHRPWWSKLLETRKARWASLAGVLGGSLLAALVLWLVALSTAPSHSGVSPAPVLAGELEVRIWRPDADRSKRGAKITEPGVLPVRNGDLAQLEVHLDQPAFVYLLWIESGGQVKPLYPWDPAHGFLGSLTGDSARSHLRSPPEMDRGWEVKSPTGLETALLLVRRTPLPADVNLAGLIGTLAPTRLTNPHEMAWLELSPGLNRPRQEKVVRHDLVTEESKRIDEPIINLLERLRPYFELMKAVRFAHLGD